MIERLPTVDRLTNSGNVAIFMFKPDGLMRTVGDYPLPELVEAMFDSMELSVVSKTKKSLTEMDVRELYRILNEPSEFGEAWKLDVINHLTTTPVVSYLLEGKDAHKKAKILKDHLRDCLSDPSTERGKVVENIAHVPDIEDMFESICVLFGEENG